MKLNHKLAIAFLGVGTGVFGLSSGAFAGSGGAAGAAAFTVTDGKVTGVAVSAAVGKDNAAAAAYNNGANNSAFALGSASGIDIEDMDSKGSGYIYSYRDNDLEIAQNNDLTGASSIQLGTTSGDAVVNIPATTTTP